VYRVDPRGVEALRSYLDRLWDSALAAFAEAVETGETGVGAGEGAEVTDESEGETS
jgi:hypothetical protein